MSFKEDAVSVSELVLNLCNHLAKNDQKLASTLYKLASSVLSSSSLSSCCSSSDEPLIVTQIQEVLREKSEDHVRKFDLLYSNICKTNILQQRWTTLSFIHKLAAGQSTTKKFSFTEFNKFRGNSLSKRPGSSSAQSLSLNPSQDSLKQLFVGQSTSSSRIQSSTILTSSCPTSRISSSSITENDLLQDVIYSFQGIEGRFIKREAGNLGFFLDIKLSKTLSPIQRGLVERLVGLSFLHNQLKQYCEDNDKHSGIVCQALIATLREELSEYYRTVALLQANMKKSDLTLRRALYIIHDHHTKFEWLAYISEICSEKKGGALISTIHGFLQHGSNCAQEVSQKVLTSVCKPLFIMLNRWLLDGEINDPSKEFFIETRGIIQAERLWHDKYHVRESMVPSFMTMEQANRILATGKCINFLRQICKDAGELPGRDSLQKLFRNSGAEALFTPELSLEFHATLENVYKETSLRVLDLLKNKFRLFEHLQSLRKYLLLGQGDFIRHLMELLAPELNKPGQEIFCHSLTAILETAIRVTNAQFEDEDTLKRLNIKVLVPSINDFGWDVFSLVYLVDGPVGTIFQPTMSSYERLFGALWRAKRTEYILSVMRKQQITMSKVYRKIKELKPVMHTIHILSSEMIYFLHQTQYYFLFEVLECSWAEMLHQVNKAESFDDIILAHSKFLASVEKGVLLDDSSRELFLNLVIIYNFTVQLETFQTELYETVTKEHTAYLIARKKKDSSKGFGWTTKDEQDSYARIAEFRKFLASTQMKVKLLSDSYGAFVKKYLQLLSTSSNMNLQLLSVRLNFNNFYKTL